MAKIAPTIKEMFNLAVERVPQMFAMTGEILPMWHVVFGNNEHHLIATPWDSPEAKEATVEKLREIFADKQVKRYVFMTEAWTVSCRDEKEAENAMRFYHEEEGLRAHPDRREIVMVKGEDRDGTTVRGHFFILRPEHGKPRLSALHVDDDIEGATGLMEGMLT